MTLVGLNSGLTIANETAITKEDLIISAAMRATQLLCLTTENITIDNLA